MIDLNPGNYFKIVHKNYIYFGQIVECLSKEQYKVNFLCSQYSSSGHLFNYNDHWTTSSLPNETWVKVTEKQMEHEIKMIKSGNVLSK